MTRLNLLLLAILVGCAVSLVASRHQARKLFVELERGQSRARAYEVEYGQLQLEQSTWSMPARVEKIAREQLHMQVPGAGRVEVVAIPAVDGAASATGPSQGARPLLREGGREAASAAGPAEAAR